MKKLLYVLFVFGFVTKGLAQDPEFTQFNSVPLYLNPAFTGSTKEHRFAAAYRNQWPGVQKSFSSYMASYDYNLSKYSSGLGGFVIQDKAGSSVLTNTQFGLNYSYGFELNPFTKLKGGLQGCFSQKSYNYNLLTFNDQLITGTSVSLDEANPAASIQYFDVGTGLLLENKLYWLGVSARHIDQPNVSLKGGKEALPMLLSVHGGYVYELEKAEPVDANSTHYIQGLMHYRHQSVYDQLDIGASYFYKVINFTVWYRGLPFKKYKPTSAYTTKESVAFMLGYEPKGKGFKIGYSYDLTISSLSMKNTGGTHEVTLVYEVGKEKAARRSRKAIGGSMKF